MSTPSFQTPSVTTNCTGSRASCGTGNGSDLEVADDETIMAVEAVHVGHAGHAFAHRGQRPEGEPHRNAMARREGRNAADVIGVFVRDDNGVEGFGRNADARQARRGVAHAESAVDHDAGGPRFDDEAVALAAAADRREAHYDFRVT